MVTGFDTGPGNVLMDYWCERHCGRSFDSNRKWAAGGQVVPALLQRLLDDPYFHLSPPKSTGREYFNEAWLTRLKTEVPQDVQATLAALTAQTIAAAVRSNAPETGELFVCGGGAHNRHLLTLLEQALPEIQINTTAEQGIAPLHVEATAFAWLALETLAGRPG